MFNTALAALLIQLIASPVSGGDVRGVVRSDVTGMGIPGATVSVANARVLVTSDSAGRYILSDIAPGAHRLRFVAPGFDTLIVDVLLAADAALHLDVSLTRVPATLPAVRVVANVAPSTTGVDDASAVGAWHMSRADIESTPATDDVDLFQLLALAPQAQVAVESQAAVHVRGGASDQNLFLLDGAPVYSPLHGAQAMSAFSPDIVDELELHGGAPSARYGGRLSSVIDVRTPAAIPSVIAARGAIGANALRTAVDIPLVASYAALTLSGRHSFGGLLHDGRAEAALPGAWSDVFGKLAIRAGASEITFSSFIADNGLGFPSTPTSEVTEKAPQRRNAFEWTTATQAASWRLPLGSGTTLETHLWRARFDALAVWESHAGPLVLGNRLQNAGGVSVLAVPHRGGVFTVGAQAERMTTSYDAVAAELAGVDSSTATLHLGSAPQITSAFVEDVWHSGAAWTFDAGLRGIVATGAAARIEPRAAVTFRPNSRIAVSAGYARMHQYSQSLRNEESVLGTILAPDLLVAVGTGGMPVASSDELTASTTLTLDAHTHLDLDWYARALHGLVLVAPVTGEPFATRAFAIGSGHAWGGGASLERRLDRLTLQGTWSLGRVTRFADGARYRPSFAPGQSASFAAAYRLGAHTRFRSAIWTSTGRLTTPLADQVGWDTNDAFTGSPELSGTPEHRAGALSGSPLPNYVRIDFGVRHSVLVRRFGVTLTGFADVNNALSRENVTAYASPSAGSRRQALLMLPSSALVGLEWKY